jgi:hypothetical protein
MELFSFFLSFSKGQFSLKEKTMWQLQIKILRPNFHKNKFFRLTNILRQNGLVFKFSKSLKKLI